MVACDSVASVAELSVAVQAGYVVAAVFAVAVFVVVFSAAVSVDG